MRTLVAPSTHEGEKVRGSRFVGDAAPCADEDDALAFVATIRDRHPDASHHCWAFRLEDGRERSSDDGEPAGTAGAPIQRRIGGADLQNVVVVVTRWFGGTKLGTGGLVRAYGGAAAEVLANASIDVRQVTTTLLVTHPYDLSGVVDGLVVEHGATVLESTYGVEVVLRLAVGREQEAAFRSAVNEATSGRVEARRPT